MVGHDSGWQSSSLYSDTGLQPNQCYGYLLKAQDSLGNMTATSTASTTYTLANVPGAPTLGSPSATTLTLTNAANGNPASNPTTLFAVQITSTTPNDSTWLNEWVNGSGNPSATEVWLTDAQLAALVITGLQPNTIYQAQSKARNQNAVETSLSSAGSGTTGAAVSTSARTIRLKGGVRLKGKIRLR